MITKFVITKNDKAEGRQPQYFMRGKEKEDGKNITLASIWLQDGPTGKFFSGTMKTEFKKEDGTVYDGYVIITEKEYKELESFRRQSDPELIAMHAKVNAPKVEEEDESSIPF